MNRTIATLGVVGLGLLGATVSANAAPSDKITICHATHSASNPYVPVTISLAALSRHVVDTNDIVPANAGDFMPNGQNLTPENIAILNAGCQVASPPVDPVVSPPVSPVVSPPVTSPPVTSPPANPVDPVGPAEQAAPVPPPVVTRVVPPVVPPVAAPTAPVPAAVIPAAAGAVAAPDAAITNVGYNVQTAVGGKADAGIPGWLAGLTGLFSAVAAFVVLRSGVRARKTNH